MAEAKLTVEETKTERPETPGLPPWTSEQIRGGGTASTETRVPLAEPAAELGLPDERKEEEEGSVTTILPPEPTEEEIQKRNDDIKRKEAQHELVEKKVESLRATFVDALIVVGRTTVSNYEAGKGLWAQIAPKEKNQYSRRKLRVVEFWTPQPKAPPSPNRRLPRYKLHSKRSPCRPRSHLSTYTNWHTLCMCSVQDSLLSDLLLWNP